MRCLQLVDEPATAAEAAVSSSNPAKAAGADSYTGSLEDAVLHNANQFHKWHTELESACASETEEKYKRYAGLLGGYLGTCDGLQEKVGGVILQERASSSSDVAHSTCSKGAA